MEDKVLVTFPIGSFGSGDLAWKSACLILSVSMKVGPLKMTTSIEVDSMEAFDEIAKAIPGKIDDAVVGVIKAALAVKKA